MASTSLVRMNGKKELSIRHLLCPELYEQLGSRWPYTPNSGSSFESCLENLLVAPPITTLRVNRLKCTDTSAALAAAQKCLGVKGHIHPNFEDMLVFPHQQQAAAKTGVAHSNFWLQGCIDTPSPSACDGAPQGVPLAENTAGESPKTAYEEEEVTSAAHLKVPMVVVGAQCGQAVLRGSHVFAPGVLAAERGIKEGALVSVWAIPRPFRCTGTTEAASSGPGGPKDASARMPSTRFLRGAYIDEPSRQEVERWGVFCGMGRVVQPLKKVFLNSKGIAVQMQGYVHLVHPLALPLRLQVCLFVVRAFVSSAYLMSV